MLHFAKIWKIQKNEKCMSEKKRKKNLRVQVTLNIEFISYTRYTIAIHTFTLSPKGHFMTFVIKMQTLEVRSQQWISQVEHNLHNIETWWRIDYVFKRKMKAEEYNNVLLDPWRMKQWRHKSRHKKDKFSLYSGNFSCLFEPNPTIYKVFKTSLLPVQATNNWDQRKCEKLIYYAF